MLSWFSASQGYTPQTRRPTILIVDDDRDIRELYRACFDVCGFSTAEASTGSEAIAAADRLVPDVVLTDFVLPDIDGITVARTLKERVKTAGVRVIMMTGLDVERLREAATSAGILRSLQKPCLPDAMLREVRRVLRVHTVPMSASAG